MYKGFIPTVIVILLMGVAAIESERYQKAEKELIESQATVVQLTVALVKSRHSAESCTDEAALKWWADTTSLAVTRQKLCGKQQQQQQQQQQRHHNH